jgi:hypothetical protein
MIETINGTSYPAPEALKAVIFLGGDFEVMGSRFPERLDSQRWPDAECGLSDETAQVRDNFPRYQHRSTANF